MNKETLREKLVVVLKVLTENDGMLFRSPVEEDTGYDARKLHEVCINHKLAEHLADIVIPNVETGEKLFADIEFNREGINFKAVEIEGKKLVVRPDVIIHNRKSGQSKFNFLVVECKKAGAYEWEIKQDRDKIVALMKGAKYQYQFGLQLIYGENSVVGHLFFCNGTEIKAEVVSYP